MSIKKSLLLCVTALMIGGIGAPAMSSSINASAHTRYSLNHYHHKQNIHKYNRKRIAHKHYAHKYNLYRLHHHSSIRSLENQLGLKRFNQANGYLKKGFYPNSRKSFFRSGNKSFDVSEASNGMYYNKSKFVRNYIKGLNNYYRYSNIDKNYFGRSASNQAAMCGAFDANYYASRLITQRYAKQHHMSHKWLKTNLDHPIYGMQSEKPGFGMTPDFMGGVQSIQFREKSKKDIRYQMDEDPSLHQFRNGLNYGYNVKSRYYRLRNPSYHELTYLNHCHYININGSNSAEDPDGSINLDTDLLVK